MGTIVSWLLAEAWPYVLGALALFGGWFAARQSGKTAGRQAAEREQQESEAKARWKANEIDQGISALDDDSVRQRAADWVRGKDGR